MSNIRIRKIEGTWVVRSGGAVLGESSNVLELSEGDHTPVLYFPRGDIAMAMLDKSPKVENVPEKGDMTFFNIVNMSSVNENAAWSFEAPKDDIADIADHLAFAPLESLKVEQV